MSESRSNVEIEDVLSSIRRLVSQDGSHTPRVSVFRATDPGPHAPEAEPTEPECLVLTPSLRVAEIPRAAAPETSSPRAANLADPAPAAPIPGGADWGESHEAAGEAHETAADAEAPTDTAFAPEPEAAPDVTDDDAQEVRLDAAWRKPVAAAPDLGEELTRLETAIAEMEVAVSASDEEFEPEQGHPFAGDGLSPLAALHEVFETGSNARAADVANEETDPVSPATTALMPEPERSAPKLTAPEGAVPEAFDWVDPVAPQRDELTAEDWAEDEGAALHAAREVDENGPRRLHLADATAEARAPELRRSSYQDLREEAEDDAFDLDAPGLFDAPDDAVIDEEALRALVSEIIRQELQGTLGERITRNVRKLVRREIQRALASRDFE